MRNKSIDVASLQPITLQQLLAKLGLLAHRELEDRLPILVDIVHLLLHRVVGGGIQAAAARHVQRAGTGTVNLVDVVDEPKGIVFRRLQNHGTRTVAKNHASRAIRVINNRRHHVGADHHHLLVHAGGHKLGTGLHSVQKRGAGGRKIESPDPGHAQFVLHEAGCSREKHIRRDRSHNDRLQLGCRESTLGESIPSCLCRQVAGGNSLLNQMAFANASALQNPLVGGFDHLFQVAVGQNTGRNVGSKSADLHAQRLVHSAILHSGNE